ncbi:MAG: type II toxin-antitoxin system RelE/ParE family toxin [Gammaproteobacteria bacterium]|nr:type II toxin-antitoxin system RelE/ParE family toxin [Gammaproteobacteria bacterium]
MNLKVVFRRVARREFDEAALWYEARRTGLGARLVSKIDQAVALAAESPQRFPYSVFFRVEVRRIVVLAVFHARRDPTIWQQRA